MKWLFLILAVGMAGGCSGGCGEATPSSGSDGPKGKSKAALTQKGAKADVKRGGEKSKAVAGDGKAELNAPAPAPVKHAFPPPEGFVYQKPPALKFGNAENAVQFDAPADHETCEGDGCAPGPEFSGTVTLYKHPRIEAATRTPQTPEVKKFWAENQPPSEEEVRLGIDGSKSENDARQPLTLAALEAALVSCNVCKMMDQGPDRDCTAFKTLDEIRRDRRNEIRELGPPVAEIFKRFVTHAHPVVRLTASQLLSSFFGNTRANQDLLLKVAKKENVPQVYRVLLRGFRPAVARNPEVLALLLEAADSGDERTRAVAIGGLASRGAKGVKGALERVLVAVEKDPSELNRQLACRQIGNQADDRALPMFEQNTLKAKGEDDSFYSGCFVGLVTMWSAAVPHEKPSQKAYELTLRRLKAKPRVGKQVPWVAISNLGWAGKPGFAASAPWFDKGALNEALADIVQDRKVNWVTRATVAKTMKKLGASKEVFETARKSYLDVSYKPGPHYNVYREIVKQMAKIEDPKEGDVAAEGGKITGVKAATPTKASRAKATPSTAPTPRTP